MPSSLTAHQLRKERKLKAEDFQSGSGATVKGSPVQSVKVSDNRYTLPGVSSLVLESDWR